jgi:hypothetical protein
VAIVASIIGDGVSGMNFYRTAPRLAGRQRLDEPSGLSLLSLLRGGLADD